jgi:hypothetical protein
VLVHLASWKDIADRLGHEAVDVATGGFEGVCRYVTSDADASALISMTVFGGYWVDEDAGTVATQRVSKYLPLTVSTQTMTIEVAGRAYSVHRPAGEGGAELYRRAQSEMERIVATLDPSLRYPALPPSWESVMESPD